MSTSASEKFIRNLLNESGIALGGSAPWDIQVHNSDLFERVLKRGTLGLGEAYMDGWWDVPHLDEFFYRVLSANLGRKLRMTPSFFFYLIRNILFNYQNKARAFIVGEHHYDVGHDIYEAMLDKRLVYTCGYWKNATDLDAAQEAKLELVCQKVGLKAGMKVLDIGCGWGSFARYAVEKYGVEVVGVTVSKKQKELGEVLSAGLPIEIQFRDYRDITGVYDRIVSIGMFEAVGLKNYQNFMDVARGALADDGLFLLHTVGNNYSVRAGNPWTNKYIFPGGMLPSIKQVGAAIEKRFVMEDWHNFGADYDRTLMTWFHNFDAAWPALRNSYDERFYRMWKYYLLSCSGAFRARFIQLWQIALSPNGVPGGYTRIS